LKIDDFRRGVVRVCDGEGSTRGTGFFVSQSGHVLTCDHVVQGAPQLSVTLVDGRNIPATLAPELSVAELDFAVLNTNVMPDFVVPVEFAGAAGDSVWASGFQMQGQVTDALPSLGTISGQTALSYLYGDRAYNLPEILRLQDALVEPGISGGCAALQRDMVVVGAVNARLPAKGGFIVPFRAIRDQTCGLYKLLQQNRQTVPRYGKYLNWPALSELCRRSCDQAVVSLEKSGRYSRELYVERGSVNCALDRFVRRNKKSQQILPMIGQTGTGKTASAARMVEVLRATGVGQIATSLLFAYRLSPHPDGLAASVAADLSKANKEMPALSAADLMSAIAASPNSGLIVILDGLNELKGTIDDAREWLESTCDWIRQRSNIRLVVTCRPEYWSSTQELVDSDLLYSDEHSPYEGDAPLGPEGGQRFFELTDFTQEEANEASHRYRLPIREGANIFRHPLFYGIARKGEQSGTATPLSGDRLFGAYVEAVVNRVRSGSPHPPSSLAIRAMIERLATTLRANNSLWIDRTQFLDAFSADRSVADALLGEHLLVEGEEGVRFAFDETAHYFVAQVAAKEFDQKAAEGIDWRRFRKEDPIGADSMSFVVASLEAQGKTDSVAKILDGLAAQSHSEDEFESYRQQTLFLRLLQWLQAPAHYFSAIVIFVNACTSHPSRTRVHSLTPLIDLSGISSAQQMQLLSMLVRLENDRDNRWKDWKNLSESEFWNERSYLFGMATFRLSLKRVLERNPDITIPALIEWVKDQTKIFSDSPPSEATVSDVACGMLYHSADKWLEPIVDGLARIVQVDNAGFLIFEIVQKHPAEMLDVCERWASDGELAVTLPIRTAGILLEMCPKPAQTTRLVAILDTMLQQANSPDVQAAIADSFSRNPSTAPRALSMAEELLQEAFPVDPWLLRRLISLDPDRVFSLLDSIIVQGEGLNRREWATSALEELARIPGRVLKLLSVVESYLSRYPELGHSLGLVIEELLRATKIGSLEDDALDAWLRANYSKLPSNVRVPIIFGVFNRSGRDPAGIPLLRTVIAVETPEDNLGKLVELLSRSSLPMSTRLTLLKPCVQKFDEINPRYLGLLLAIEINRAEEFGRFLAEQVALDPTTWSSTVVEYSTRVLAGEDPLDTADRITTRELEGGGPGTD
jgi:hypothetical protein